MPFNTILYDMQENILTITFNRPEKLNAFSRELVHETIEAFQLAEADDEVHLVIVTGAGRAFSAGGASCVPALKRACNAAMPVWIRAEFQGMSWASSPTRRTASG